MQGYKENRKSPKYLFNKNKYTINSKWVNKMIEKYRKLMDEIFTGNGEGIADRLCEILPGWEQQIFIGAAVPLYDKEKLRNNNEAASFLISMPQALRNGAVLCGSNGAQAEAKHLMKLSLQLAELLEKARVKAHIEKERLEKITRILVAFDYAKQQKNSKKAISNTKQS